MSEVFPVNACAYAIVTADLVTLATSKDVFWSRTFREKYKGIELHGYSCGVFIADCGEWLDSRPELLVPSAREMRSIFRHQFRAIHIFALGRILVDDERTGLQLPDIGTPVDEVDVRDPESQNRYAIESAYRLARRDESGLPIDYLIGHRPSFHRAIAAETISKSLKLACDVANRGDDHRHILSLLYDSIRSYENSLFHQAFIACWAATEKCLVKIYRAQVLRTTDTRRIKKLEDGSTFTMAGAMKLLASKGILTPEEYEQVDKARHLRNDFLHSLHPIEPGATAKLLLGVRSIVGKALGFEPAYGLLRVSIG